MKVGDGELSELVGTWNPGNLVVDQENNIRSTWDDGAVICAVVGSRSSRGRHLVVVVIISQCREEIERRSLARGRRRGGSSKNVKHRVVTICHSRVRGSSGPWPTALRRSHARELSPSLFCNPILSLFTFEIPTEMGGGRQKDAQWEQQQQQQQQKQLRGGQEEGPAAGRMYSSLYLSLPVTEILLPVSPTRLGGIPEIDFPRWALIALERALVFIVFSSRLPAPPVPCRIHLSSARGEQHAPPVNHPAGSCNSLSSC